MGAYRVPLTKWSGVTEALLPAQVGFRLAEGSV